jgi:RNA polymerase sigma factor (sigma-70 family)
MTTSPMSVLIQHLLAPSGREGAGMTDGELLTRFLSRRDDAALAFLVRRHAPMVWGVCHRLLQDYHDAEDAFQATFLVLVRKAATVVPREAVANWLYGVAHQTAVRARATAAQRKVRERQVSEMPEPPTAERDLWTDLQPLLDQEMSRLPVNYRTIIVLCDLEGMTRKEAAQHLNLPEGTVGSRLARARAILAKRLTRRGIALSGGALAAMSSLNVASAVVPTSMVSSTIKAASLFAAGQAATCGVISAKVAALTEGVMKAMLFHKLKRAFVVLLMVMLVGIGATVLLADDKGDRVGYQYHPPGISPIVINDEITIRPGEVALDANAGRNKPYFRQSDPTNINHQWELRKTGDYYMILPKVGEGKVALDANGGKGNPYFRQTDATNINHLWKLTRVGACYLIVSKVGEGELALNANGGKDKPYLGKADTTDNNCLWEIHKTGDHYMIVPLVKVVMTPNQEERQGLDMEQEIEKIVKRAEEAGGDRKTTLDAIEKTVKDMKEKAKNK